MTTWEVKFHDSHAWDEACDGDECNQVTRVQADNPLGAAIKAFQTAIEDMDDDFRAFAQDRKNWHSETSHDFWLDTDESECCLYPLSVREVRFPKA